MSVMIAEPLPSTLMDSSSTVGVRPTMMISFAPGCSSLARGSGVVEGMLTYLELEILDLSNYLSAGREESDGFRPHIPDLVLHLVSRLHDGQASRICSELVLADADWALGQTPELLVCVGV